MNWALKIANKLEKSGFKTYAVWGYCRDKLLWKPNSEIDLCTDALPEDIKKELNVIWEIGSKYGTMIVEEEWKVYEITTFRKDIWTVNNRKPAEVIFTKSLEEDAKRRDFTINAIYFDILNDEFIDPVWGVEDLIAWRIRFIWEAEERLEEDILRALRYIRFKNKYDFEGSKEDLISIKRKINLLENISQERIKQELDKIFLHYSNVRSLVDFRDITFFWNLCPYITLSDAILRFEILNKNECKDVDLYYSAVLLNTQFYTDFFDILLFSSKTKKKIWSIIKNFENLYFWEDLEKDQKLEFYLSNTAKESIMLFWKYSIKESYEDFMENYELITLPTSEEIMKEFPNLRWKELWDKIKEEQNKILIWLI